MNSDIPSIGNEKALLVTFLLLVGDSEPDRRNSVSVKSPSHSSRADSSSTLMLANSWPTPSPH